MKFKHIIIFSLLGVIATITFLYFDITSEVISANHAENDTTESEVVIDLQEDEIDAVTQASEKMEDNKESVINRFFSSLASNNKDEYASLLKSDATLVFNNDNIDFNMLFNQKYQIHRVEEYDDVTRFLLSSSLTENSDEYFIFTFTTDNDQIEGIEINLATEDDLSHFQNLTLERNSILPSSYLNYLNAVINDDLDNFMASFTEDAKVIDVSRHFDGQASIRAWANNEVMFLTYSVGRVEFKEDGVEVINNIKLSKNSNGFYGSYYMRFENGLIDYADLQYSNAKAYNY